MRTIIRFVLINLCIGLLIGCATENASVSGGNATENDLNSMLHSSRTGDAPMPGSLFREDQAVISNESIEQVLNAKITLPENAKLAAVRFGQMPYWWGWSEDFVRTNQQIDDDFLGRLRQTRRLRKVMYLPSMITPTNMTIPFLREAAARCQANLLLIYRTSSHSYDKQRFLGPDEVKAYCTVEAVLLDTKTGTIPFSTVVTKDFAAQRSRSDTDFSETVAKAQQQAIGSAWLKLADEVKSFLDAQAESQNTK